MKGVVNINLLVFGICLIIVSIFALWLPIALIGLIVLFLILARLSLGKDS